MKTADIVTGSVSAATETDINGERDREREHRDREREPHRHIDRDRTAIEKESGARRDETMGAETTVAVVRALTGSTRNTDRTTISAASSGAMLTVVTVEGVGLVYVGFPI